MGDTVDVPGVTAKEYSAAEKNAVVDRLRKSDLQGLVMSIQAARDADTAIPLVSQLVEMLHVQVVFKAPLRRRPIGDDIVKTQ